MPIGIAIALASATISIVPGIAEEAAGRVGAEEVAAPGADALLDQVVEDEDERHQRDEREHERDAARDAVGGAAAAADCGKRIHPAIPWGTVRWPRSARLT